MKKIIIVTSTFFYFGYSPIAPGTVGTIGGVILYFIIRKIFCADWILYTGSILFLFALGVYVSTKAEEIFKKKDAHPIVIDEVVGFLITMFMIPFSWGVCLAGFLINRILDIIKPFPAKEVQNLSGGYGIMLDDVISSIYSNLVIRAMLLLIDFP